MVSVISSSSSSSHISCSKAVVFLLFFLLRFAEVSGLLEKSIGTSNLSSTRPHLDRLGRGW